MTKVSIHFVIFPSLILWVGILHFLPDNVIYFLAKEYSALIALTSVFIIIGLLIRNIWSGNFLWLWGGLYFSFFLNTVLQANLFISNLIITLMFLLFLALKNYKEKMIKQINIILILFITFNLLFTLYQIFNIKNVKDNRLRAMYQSMFIPSRKYARVQTQGLLDIIKENYREKSLPIDFKIKPNIYFIVKEGGGSAPAIETYDYLESIGVISKKKLEEYGKKYYPMKRYFEDKGFYFPYGVVGYHGFTEASTAAMFALNDLPIPLDPGGFANFLIHFYNPVFKIFRDNGYTIYNDYFPFSLSYHQFKVTEDYIESVLKEVAEGEVLYDYIAPEESVYSSPLKVMNNAAFVTQEILIRFKLEGVSSAFFTYYGETDNKNKYQATGITEEIFEEIFEDKFAKKSILYEEDWDTHERRFVLIYTDFKDKLIKDSEKAESWGLGTPYAMMKNIIDTIRKKDPNGWIITSMDHSEMEFLSTSKNKKKREKFNNFVLYNYYIPDQQYANALRDIQVNQDTFRLLFNELSGKDHYPLSEETFKHQPFFLKEIEKLSKRGELREYFPSRHWSNQGNNYFIDP